MNDPSSKMKSDEQLGQEQELEQNGVSSGATSVTLKPTKKNQRSSILEFILSFRPFQGIIRDIRSRAPYYWSDWKDAWNYRVVPATVLIFFAK